MSEDRTIATNRRARHEYEILETLEAGLVLRGTEVKSLRAGQVNFKDSYATVKQSEMWLLGCHIPPYSHGTDANHDPERDRKLLLHRKEITRLVGKVAERGLTVVPLKLYFKGGRVTKLTGKGGVSENGVAHPIVRMWRNWQTRMVQVHVLAREWGFNSLQRHF